MRKLETFCLLGWVLIPGYWTLTGPKELMCYEGESLSVRCRYEERFKQSTKFWCKGSVLTLCSSPAIKTSSEDLVQNEKVSIRDNKGGLYFEITIDKLKHEDSGTYQCGIETGLVTNDRHYIQVTVSSDPKQTSATETKTTEKVLTCTEIPPSEKPKDRELYILVYCTIPLFLLLIVAAVVLFIVSRKKKKGLGWKRKKEIKLQSMALNMPNVGSEQSVPHHQLSTDGTGLYCAEEIHPENNYEEPPSQEKSSSKRDEVPYATLNILDPQQQSTYVNVGFTPSPALSKSQEVIYTEVAKRATE